MRQAEAFLESEGDAFYDRNRFKSRLPDPVLDVISDLKLRPKWTMEVGCGDGWRLEAIRGIYGSSCMGIEASAKAILKSRPSLDIKWEDATFLEKYLTDTFDLIIFGFCLYVIDRKDLFKIVAEADRILLEGGHIIIHDFFSEYPYRRPYAHKEGLWSYKMDYSKLWLAHPGYKEIRTDLVGEDDERTGVAVLQKDFTNAFPLRVP